jgi:uncharacterized protein YdeI (YjbR/CyaY-like superfamily)
MAVSRAQQSLEAYFRKPAWRAEAAKLRAILLAAGLNEERKWAQPCYTYDGKNIAIIQRMKDFIALAFFKGALLLDHERILEAPGSNSRHGRRIRFTSVREVTRLKPIVLSYIREATEIEKSGRTVGKAPTPSIVAELQAKLDDDDEFRRAFEGLTPGRQRGYSIYFADAKQSSTRQARIERLTPKILAGKGFHDR